VPGRELKGIHFAMEYLTLQNRRNEGDQIPDDQFISAHGKHVIIIGGGDTGADCLGTAHRQGAASVHQLELLTRPPDDRLPNNPWPTWPNIFRVSTAHEEGGERLYSISTQRFTGDANGQVTTLHACRVELVQKDGRTEFVTVPGSEFELKADLVLLAMGFTGPETDGMLGRLGVKLTDRGNVWRDERWMTSVPGVFTAGDMQRGQSLIVWAIAEGRSCASAVDEYLMGRTTLPAPLA
jgi:glutamate synthase (NADPH/NADH) small chain